MKASYFITGTDTNVGKTLVTAALVSAFRDRGYNCAPFKPVQCGRLRGMTDIEWCLSVLGLHDSLDANALSPCAFEIAASPHLAAAMAGKTLSARELADAAVRASRHYDMLLIEGAGGVLVPLNGSETMIDVMIDIGSPVILVARSGLGTLNHTALTIESLRRAKLSIAAVVVNNLRQPEDDTTRLVVGDNIEQIRRMASPAPVVVFDNLTDINRATLSPLGNKLAEVLP